MLIKQYILLGIGEYSGWRSVAPPKKLDDENLNSRKIQQGITKVMYLSFHIMNAWLRYKTVKIPNKYELEKEREMEIAYPGFQLKYQWN